MVIQHLMSHGLFYALFVNLYLFILMISTSPRVWGYADYPQVVKDKVLPQTRREKLVAILVGLPWFIFTFGFPIFSTYALKSKLGNEISFGIAFINMFTLSLLANLGDLVILDWLVISRITPKFVIIPGSEASDYKDFSHHYKGHARASLIITGVCALVAGVASFFG